MIILFSANTDNLITCSLLVHFVLIYISDINQIPRYFYFQFVLHWAEIAMGIPSSLKERAGFEYPDEFYYPINAHKSSKNDFLLTTILFKILAYPT